MYRDGQIFVKEMKIKSQYQMSIKNQMKMVMYQS